MNDSVVAIVSAFFIIGITAGVIAVIAMSALRADRRGGPGDPGDLDDPGDLLEYGLPGPPGPPPDPRWNNAGPHDHSDWPGNVDNDFSGR
jgi:hypothetical protein